MTKQTCRSMFGLARGIKAEAILENKNILNSLSVVIYKNKRNVLCASLLNERRDAFRNDLPITHDIFSGTEVWKLRATRQTQPYSFQKRVENIKDCFCCYKQKRQATIVLYPKSCF